MTCQNLFLSSLMAISILCCSCESPGVNSQKINTESSHENGITKEPDQADSALSTFLNGFAALDSLPLTLKARIDYEISPQKEIDRNLVIKFLCKGDENCITQPGGGLYQYYYMYQYAKSNRSRILIYCVVGSSGYQCVLTSLSNRKELMAKIVLCEEIEDGVYQRDGEITRDFKIMTKSIKAIRYIENAEDTVRANVRHTTYWINDLGEIKLHSEGTEKTSIFYYDADLRFKLYSQPVLDEH